MLFRNTGGMATCLLTRQGKQNTKESVAKWDGHNREANTCDIILGQKHKQHRPIAYAASRYNISSAGLH